MSDMETKMITIPFEVEKAKKIQAGEEPGKIVTRDGKDARVVCWDFHNWYGKPIIAIYENEYGYENFESRLLDGSINRKDDNKDLMLQVPEWTQYKDGDIIYCETTDGRGDKYIWIAVMKELRGQDPDGINIDFYFSIDIEGDYKGKIGFDGLNPCADYVRLATDDEKQKLIDALKASTAQLAKEYLKRFFGIEEEQECEFEFLQPVLVSDGKGDSWKYGEFIFKRDGIYYVNGGLDWMNCIPYNDQTKHLLGTTDDF